MGLTINPKRKKSTNFSSHIFNVFIYFEGVSETRKIKEKKGVKRKERGEFLTQFVTFLAKISNTSLARVSRIYKNCLILKYSSGF